MRKIFFLQLLLFVFKANAQQTVQTRLSLASNGVNSTEILMYKEDNTSYYDLYSNLGGFGIFNSATSAHSFYVSPNDLVGIGTVTPTQKLEVNGGINANGYYLKNSGTSDYPGSYLHRLRAADGNFYIDGDIGSSVYAPAVTIHRHGNVGIGTAEMQGYKLAVNGKIRAREIKVENINWPDFVFAKEYQLPTLQETEKHIKENGHLPGIPSAAEVKANGINLGEMNAKLLQEIEELTLHLIEKGKQISSLQEKDKINQIRAIRERRVLNELIQRIEILEKKKNEE